MTKIRVVIAGIILTIFAFSFIAFTPPLPAKGGGATQTPMLPGPDDFDSPASITLPGYDVFYAGKATHASDDPTACAPYGGSLWYKYIATTSATVTVNTEGATFDTVAAVYTGTRGNLTMVGCNDDQGSGFDRTSWVDFSAVSGTTYYIMVGSYGSSTPTENLPVSLSTVGNDDPPTGKWIPPYAAPPFTYTENIYGSWVSGYDPNSSCVNANYSNTVWYRYYGSSSSTISMSTYGSSYDTVLDVYSGSPTALTPVICNDDSGNGNLTSLVTFSPVVGTTYYIRVSKYNSTATTTAQTLVFTLTAGTAPHIVNRIPNIGNISQPTQTPTFIPPTPHP